MEHEKFLGLDLEYTADQRGVAVIQLCFKHHVLIFQWARYVLRLSLIQGYENCIYIVISLGSIG